MKNLKIILIGFLVFHSLAVIAGDEMDQSIPEGGLPPTFLMSTPANSEQGALQTSVESCESSYQLARKICTVGTNVDIQTAAGAIGLLLSGTNAVRSMSQTCQDYNKAMQIAETALTAYNAACAAMQMKCESACGKTHSMIGKIQSTVQKTMASPDPSQKTLAGKDQTQMANLQGSISEKNSVCEKYKLNLAAAGIGLMNTIKQFASTNQCKNNTTDTDCTKNPTAANCVAKLDCTKPENQSKPDCICERTPTAAGCPGAMANSVLGAPTPTANPTTTTPTIPNPNLSVGSEGDVAAVPGSSGAGAGGLAGGGGGAAFPAAANSKSSSVDGKKNEKAAINPNILSGYDGGGGGGGRSGGGGRPDNSAYKAYLPGGAKDPTRGLASKTFGNGEVTSAGSKSNWEKVSDRYSDNKPTLMGP